MPDGLLFNIIGKIYIHSLVLLTYHKLTYKHCKQTLRHYSKAQWNLTIPVVYGLGIVAVIERWLLYKQLWEGKESYKYTYAGISRVV